MGVRISASRSAPTCFSPRAPWPTTRRPEDSLSTSSKPSTTWPPWWPPCAAARARRRPARPSESGVTLNVRSRVRPDHRGTGTARPEVALLLLGRHRPLHARAEVLRSLRRLVHDRRRRRPLPGPADVVL